MIPKMPVTTSVTSVCADANESALSFISSLATPRNRPTMNTASSSGSMRAVIDYLDDVDPRLAFEVVEEAGNDAADRGLLAGHQVGGMGRAEVPHG